MQRGGKTGVARTNDGNFGRHRAVKRAGLRGGRGGLFPKTMRARIILHHLSLCSAAPVITEETAEFCDFHLPDLRVRVASVFHNIIPCGNVYQSTKTVFAIAAAFGGV